MGGPRRGQGSFQIVLHHGVKLARAGRPVKELPGMRAMIPGGLLQISAAPLAGASRQDKRERR